MEIVSEKSQVVDLRLDLHKQGISIGDDLNLVVNDQDQFILYFEPKRKIWSRFFYKFVPKVFGLLHPNDAEHLTKYLQNASKIRVKVVDTVPKHLSADNTDVVHMGNSDISMDGTGIACTGLPKKVLVAYGS